MCKQSICFGGQRCGLLSTEVASVWALTVLGTVGAFCVSQDCTKHLSGPAAVAMTVVVVALFAALWKKTRTLWWTVLLYSLLKNAVLLRMSYLQKAPSLFVHSGWTSIVVMGLLKTFFNVPQLLMLDLQGLPLLCLMISNVGATMAFHCKLIKHSCVAALLQAVGSQVLWYYILVALRNMHASSDAPKRDAQQGGASDCSLPKPKQSPVVGSEEEVQAMQQRSRQQQMLQVQQQQRQHTTGSRMLSPEPRLQKHSNGVISGEKEQPQVPSVLNGTLIRSNSSNVQPKSTPRPAHCYGFAHPVTRKMLAEALRAKSVRSTQQRYSSKANQSDGPYPNKTLQCAQQACRMAVKVQGPSLPENISGGAVGDLRSKLQRYQHLLLHGETPAVRSGCVVISFGVSPFEGSDQGLPMQEMRQHTAAAAKEWAQQHGLLMAEDGSLIIQACHQSSWVIAQQGQPSPSGFSMLVHTPFLIASQCPSSRDGQAPVQQQTQAELDAFALPQEQEACSCQFEVTLAAPPHLELRGWQGAADAPEELPDEVKSRSLCLLASVDGQFLPISVEQHSMSSDGERVAQARVSLLGANTFCPKEVLLEAWADGSMVCSYSAVLLPSFYSGALAELQGMMQEDEGSQLFVRDLVLWAHFLASSRSAQQQQQQQQGELAAAAEEAHVQVAEEAHQEQLALMSGVGKDLLEHSFSVGMVEVAGFLLEGLIDFPFCMPADTLLEDQLLESNEHDSLTDSSTELQGPSDASDAASLVDCSAPTSASNLPSAPSSVEWQAPPASHLPSALSSVGWQASPASHLPSEPSSSGRQASLWTAAARASMKGFGKTPDESCQPLCGQQQQQQQHSSTDQPTETGFREWGAHFSKPILSIRFNCCCFGSMIALSRAVLAWDFVKIVFMLTNIMPYIVNFYKPRAGLHFAKYVHLAIWSLMGLGLVYMEANTKNMVNLNAEAIVLVLFFSPSLDQGGLQTLILDRMLSTVVIALLGNNLRSWRPLLRSLSVNALAFTIECVMDIYFRYLYLRSLGQSQKKVA